MAKCIKCDRTVYNGFSKKHQMCIECWDKIKKEKQDYYINNPSIESYLDLIETTNNDLNISYEIGKDRRIIYRIKVKSVKEVLRKINIDNIFYRDLDQTKYKKLTKAMSEMNDLKSQMTEKFYEVRDYIEELSQTTKKMKFRRVYQAFKGGN